MINKTNFKNFKPNYSGGERMTLPPGIYEGHIINAKVDELGDAPALMIQVEIDKGEYAGFFRRQYESQQGGQYSVRYKGVYRITLPDGKDEQHDNWRKHQLEGAVWALENSNPGYKWDWDENKLKGLKIGLNIRDRDYYYNGKSGTTTEIGRLESILMMNDPDETKRPKLMKRRELSNRDKQKMAEDEARKSAPTPGPGYVEVGDDDELPFD